MAMTSHIYQLQEKHARLEGAIEVELARPAPDFGLVTAFKKQKLLIKEELARLGAYTKTAMAA
jgi:hypothetical protein